jgi:ABC-type bacteriocin/lantibiotic exporter with double-glycine peptidase domain
VFQDEILEVATLRRVILGMAPIPEERAWEAARLARIADIITNLPMGMQTMVAPMTVPSALLHQLLIARALARRPEMLVLDEALSNLDSDVQSGLVADLRRSGMTIVICTHRPSTMALADRIIRLERGGIVA